MLRHLKTFFSQSSWLKSSALSPKKALRFMGVFLMCIGVGFASQPTPPAKVRIPITHWQTPKGARVYYVQTKQIPMVNIIVAFKAGSDRDGNKPGLANLTSAMIGQSTKQLDTNQIAVAFDRLGANFKSSANQDMTYMSLQSLTDPKILNPAVKLFSQVLGQANFSKKAFIRRQRNTLQAITIRQQRPSIVANQALYKAIYGNYPYAHPVIGTLSSVQGLTPEDLQHFYRRYYVAKNALVAIVGDVNQSQAKTIAESIFANLPAGKTAPQLAPASPNPATTVAIPFPANQNYIRIGAVGINHHNPDYFPLMLANYTLGGGMVSRLFNIVREKYGLSYGVYSYFSPLANKGPFVIALQTKNATAHQALKVTKEVLNNYIDQGPTPEELQAAKDYLTGSFPLRIDSNADIASYLITIGFYHLPLDYLDTYTKKINAVTLTQVKKALKTYLHPKRMVTVIVGGATKTKPKANG